MIVQYCECIRRIRYWYDAAMHHSIMDKISLFSGYGMRLLDQAQEGKGRHRGPLHHHQGIRESCYYLLLPNIIAYLKRKWATKQDGLRSDRCGDVAVKSKMTKGSD